MDSAKFKTLMRHQAGAVTIITVGKPGQRTGLTATAMCSLTDSPPMVLICVNRNASAHAPIKITRSFAVNVLGRDHAALAKTFSTKQVEGEARFEKDVWDTLVTGAPTLKGSLATLDCELADEHEFKTHSIFIGLVKDGRFREDAEPLLYFRGDFWDLKSL